AVGAVATLLGGAFVLTTDSVDVAGWAPASLAGRFVGEAGCSVAFVTGCIPASVFKRVRSPSGRSGVPGDEMTEMIFETTPAAYGSASVHRGVKGAMLPYYNCLPGAPA